MAKIEIPTKMVAREVFMSINDDGASTLKLDRLDAEDAHFFATRADGKRYKVEITEA